MTAHRQIAPYFPIPLDLPLAPALRAATREIHERLHHHAGFMAVQNGSIGAGQYRQLLARLYGFHTAFEQTARIVPARSRWLALDLAALGMSAEDVKLIALCPAIPDLDSVERLLGARYVIEGSMLGGRALARGLDRLCGVGVTTGRRFFRGRGAGTGAAWNAYLATLDALPVGQQSGAAAVDAAVDTFRVFEAWLSDWSTPENE